MQQSSPTYAQHEAILTTDVDQWINVVAPPVRTWHTDDLVSGEFMVAAATTNPQSHHAADYAEAVQVGLLPLCQLLDNGAAQLT